MRIAADNNIPYVEAACAELGALRCFDSRNPAQLHEALVGADVLLCRSTIRVTPELLKHSNVRFVATATSGTDHIDIPALESCGVSVADAAESNARSVAEWVLAALLDTTGQNAMDFEGDRIGIIGVGHVGRQVYRCAKAIGMQPILNDPPRESRGEEAIVGDSVLFSTLEAALACEVITLHVPLEAQGEFPTAGMIGAAQFSAMKSGSIFINAARGDVMDGEACLAFAGRGGTTVLDVFPNEPDIDIRYVQLCTVATPHIAGHSLDAKLLGTQMVYDALCSWLGRVPRWRHETHLPPAPPVVGRLAPQGSHLHEVADVIAKVYDIRKDVRKLRTLLQHAAPERGAFFGRLRAEYPIRREFRRISVDCRDISTEAMTMLGELGFRIERSG